MLEAGLPGISGSMMLGVAYMCKYPPAVHDMIPYKIFDDCLAMENSDFML